MDHVASLPSGIADAIVAAGNQSELASTLGVSQQAVSKWLCRGWVPLKRANEIEAIFSIPRGRLANPRILSLVAGSPA